MNSKGIKGNIKRIFIIFQKICNVLFWAIVTALAFFWFSDYTRVNENKEPKYCVLTKIHEFEDGKVSECVGLGYKTYKYERNSMPNAIEFGPFFMKMRGK